MPIDRTNIRLNAFNRKRKRLGEDFCTIIGPTFVDGGGSGDSMTLGDLATNVEIYVEALGQRVQEVIGGEAVVLSHRLQVPRTTITGAITHEYKIKVLARSPNPQMVFEKPIVERESFSPLVTMNASLVVQGYQQ